MGILCGKPWKYRIENMIKITDMKESSFWNDAAKCGAVLGVLLAASTLFETYAVLAGSGTLMGLMVLEFVAVVVLHYVLLHRYTKRYGFSCYPVEEGFPFSKAYGYILLLSAFAGVIVGVVQAINLHAVIGYEAYMERYLAAMQDYLAQSGNVSTSMEPMMAQLFAKLKAAEAPSLLQTFWGSLWSSLLYGLVFGLIIAGVLSRAPKPFADGTEKSDNE